jgi:RNA-directed DNA polymerase
LPQERFDFLGYTFGRYYSPKTGRAYLCAQPSRKSVKRIIGKIREATERRVLWLDAETMVTRLNRVLVGWANYYSLGPVHTAYRTIDRYTPLRLRRWLCNKHKIANTSKRPVNPPHLWASNFPQF